MNTVFPYLEKEFIIKMNNGLEVKNTYDLNENIVQIDFLNGDLERGKMKVAFLWRALPDHYFLISWQESDKNTVVYCDNFMKKTSYAYYTTMNGDFYVMEGIIY